MQTTVVLGLTAGQKTGLAVVAGLFIAFAVAAAIVVPRRWPQFPGTAGLRPFLAASAAFFVGTMLAMFFLAREEEGHAEAGEQETGAVHTEGGTTSPGAARTVAVTEVDYRIRLAKREFPPATYTFVVENDGKDVHNLVVSGPRVNNATSATIGPGETTRLNVGLVGGKYKLYCSVPGHEDRGMRLEITVS